MRSVGSWVGKVLQGSSYLADCEDHPTDKPLFNLSDDAAVGVGLGLQMGRWLGEQGGFGLSDDQ